MTRLFGQCKLLISCVCYSSPSPFELGSSSCPSFPQVFTASNWETTQLNCRCSWQLLANNFRRAGEEAVDRGRGSARVSFIPELWHVFNVNIYGISLFELFSLRLWPSGSHSTGKAAAAAAAGWLWGEGLGIFLERTQKAPRQVNLTNESVGKLLLWLKSTEHVKFCSCTWKFSTQANFHKPRRWGKLTTPRYPTLPDRLYLPHCPPDTWEHCAVALLQLFPHNSYADTRYKIQATNYKIFGHWVGFCGRAGTEPGLFARPWLIAWPGKQIEIHSHNCRPCGHASLCKFKFNNCRTL